MRAKTAILMVLLFAAFLLPGCSTAKKATKEDRHQEEAATFDQTANTTTSSAATFDQAILEQILQKINVTLDFERWEFAPAEEGEPTDTLPASGALARDKGTRNDKPPNACRPTSYTKGSLNINAEGSQNRATQTSAGSQEDKAGTVSTAATVEKKEDIKSQTTETKKPRSSTWLIYLVLITAAFLCVGYGYLRRKL